MYDIGEALRELELSLIKSMRRNLAFHNNDVLAEGFDWTMWQAEKLQALETFMSEYGIECQAKFAEINAEIDRLLERMYKAGTNAEERRILTAIKQGYKATPTGAFATINEAKLRALITAVKNDMQTAETAMLRMADDVYRKAIYNAQACYLSGASTLNQAVDIATSDFLARGINCIEYANGARVGIDSYAEMALRTAGTRAKLQGESAARDDYGINTVIVTYRATACPMCVNWVGKVLYDDVYSNIPTTAENYPRLSEAIREGLYHPNCKDSHTTYFEGITTAYGEGLSPAEKIKAKRVYALQQQQRYNERMIRKYKRLEQGCTAPENIERYGIKRAQWQKRQRDLIDRSGDLLRRDYSREQI